MRNVLAAALPLLAAGCGAVGLAEARFSLPAQGEPARLVVRVEEQPVAVHFDAQAVDYAEWVEHAVGEDPPPPLQPLPPGATPDGAWVLRLRLRGSPALVPSVHLALRDGRLVYTTRREVGRLEPGAGFDVTADGVLRLTNPAGAPAVPGPLQDEPIDAK